MVTKDFSELYQALIAVTGREIIPTYEKRTSAGEFLSCEYLNSASAKIERVLSAYLDSEGYGVLKPADIEKTDLEIAETKYKFTQKKLENLQNLTLSLEVNIANIENEMSRVLDNADETKIAGPALKEEYNQCKWVLRLLEDYEQILMKDLRETEQEFSEKFQEAFAQRLRQARTEQGLTQEKLARLSCVKRLTLQRYELGMRTPSAKTLYRLAKVLGVRTDWLLNV